jgi:hypothetical protein
MIQDYWMHTGTCMVHAIELNAGRKKDPGQDCMTTICNIAAYAPIKLKLCLEAHFSTFAGEWTVEYIAYGHQ